MTSQPAVEQGVPVPSLPGDLDTPCLVVDLDLVEGNIRRLQDEMDRRGIALRPHVKTHKSVAIARLQLAAGAHGITVGNLGEAETFIAAGIDDLFLAYPIRADGPKAARLRAVHESATGFRVGVDSTEGVARLAEAVRGSARPLRVRIEIDPGNQRTGVGSPEEALVVARAARAAGLTVEGVFSHGGHSYQPGTPGPAGADEIRTLTAAAEALAADGFEIVVVSAGSTPTMLSAAGGRVNEIRAGTYSLGDRQQWLLGAIPPEGCAVFVAATVVSAFPDRLVLDAGAKSLTKDAADWLDGYGLMPAYPDLAIERLSDYHGVVPVPAGVRRPRMGEVVAVVPNHVCPVVDLFDSFVATRDGETIGIWPVDARGRSQ